MPPVGTVTYRFPDEYEGRLTLRTLVILFQALHAVVALIFKISPHQSIIALSGADPLMSGMCPKEDVGFEPTHDITAI